MFKKHLPAALTIFLTFASMSFAQKLEPAPETVTLPDRIMQQVVGRIVRWQFRPGRRPRTIRIADTGIKREWLPIIENVTFELVPESRASDFAKGVFLLEEVTRSGNVYSMNVGWTDLGCNSGGDTWKFTVQGEGVRLWPTGSTWWAGGCGGSDPPVIRGLKVGDVSPNELPGYEFFTKGKLKNIRLGVSTREDIERLFGDTCDAVCDYDANYTMFVEYFDAGVAMTQTSYVGDQKKIDTDLIAKPELVGTLESVVLHPKKRVSLSGVFFPRSFSRGSSHAIGDAWDANGFAGAVHSTSATYTDGYGLEYILYTAETFNNLRNQTKSETPAPQKGDLIGIEYAIPESLYEAVYNKRRKAAVEKR